MSNGERKPLDEARALADEVVDLLRPACERIEIAGSIRRRKADIGDVEIVAIPHVDSLADDLFGLTRRTVNHLDVLCAELLEREVFAKRPNKNGAFAWGTALKWGIYRGFNLDIYSADAATWGVTLAIRTGDAEFSHKLVTPRSQAGYCPSHLEVKGWRVRPRGGGEPLPTPEERDVFDVLQLRCIAPWQRSGDLALGQLVRAAVAA
jgi:DNA polymerase/3'-5' exonuclease PolX